MENKPIAGKDWTTQEILEVNEILGAPLRNIPAGRCTIWPSREPGVSGHTITHGGPCGGIGGGCLA